MGEDVVRVVRWFVTAVVVLVLIVLGAVVLLSATGPAPRDRAGWALLDELPEPRGEVTSTVVRWGEDEILVVAGGFRGRSARTADTVDALDPADGTWRGLPRLPAPRHHAGAAAIGGDVYVSGGATGATDRSSHDELWMLPSEAGEAALGGGDGRADGGWQPLAPMPEPRVGHRMVALDGRLLVIGGRGRSADTLVYHPDEDRWSRAAPLPIPRHHLAVVVLEGEVWALGGRDEDEAVLDVVHRWRPGDDRWRDGPRLPVPVSAAAEGVLDGAIHLVGGEDPAVAGGGVLDRHIVLRPGAPESRRWEDATPPPVATHGAGRGVIGGRLIVTGGSARQGLLSPAAWSPLTASYDPAEDR